MISFLKLSQLSDVLLEQYKEAIQNAFPDIILCSKVIENYWSWVEAYFPEYQIFLVENEIQLLGFMNAIPLNWNYSLTKLPNEGWDWMLKKGVQDYEESIGPNCLGGLQIIVTKGNLGRGFSKILIAEAKRLVKDNNFDHFIIPIRPIFKNEYPFMAMEDYIELKFEGKIYDPWIRTHLNGGAEIINVCNKAMYIDGDIAFWEKLMQRKLEKSGLYVVEGALNLIDIDIENDLGRYYEDNIWITYPK